MVKICDNLESHRSNLGLVSHWHSLHQWCITIAAGPCLAWQRFQSNSIYTFHYLELEMTYWNGWCQPKVIHENVSIACYISTKVYKRWAVTKFVHTIKAIVARQVAIPRTQRSWILTNQTVLWIQESNSSVPSQSQKIGKSSSLNPSMEFKISSQITSR